MSVHRHAGVGLFSEGEAAQLDKLVELVAEYLDRKDPGRPLCLAVFGAPGSGKSRLVKRLPELLEAQTGKDDVLAGLTEINLTQLTSIDALASALELAWSTATDRVPFVFFDEFDAGCDGAPWGWLSWFLAPMQDGQFRSQNLSIKARRAIYVFAGGTTSVFEQLGASDREAFALAKGPDFVSRLRGYINIAGVNADDGGRIARRQAALDYELGLHPGKQLGDELRTALLHVGRYKHGSRSVGALVELLPRKAGKLEVSDICEHPLLHMHVDRGPLDPRAIGGCIGVSSSDQLAAEHAGVWTATCESLFRKGAILACGGRKAGAGLMAHVSTALLQLPRPLEPDDQHWLVATAMAGVPEAPPDRRIRVLAPISVSPDEVPSSCSAIEQQRLTAALRGFRMRHQIALCCVARFAIGGRVARPQDSTRWKRFPGVAEEIMIALALGQPVYISGALGGGAEWAGVLLGLGRIWNGPPRDFTDEWLAIPLAMQALFRPPSLGDLPLTRDDLVAFFRDHALGGPRWIDNGLTDDDNRRLFELTDPTEIARLVAQGLLARVDRIGRPARPSSETPRTR